MSIVLRWLPCAVIGLAATPPASAIGDAAITVDARRTQLGDVTLEAYNGQLGPGGNLKILARGYATISIADASAPMLVQCEVTPTAAGAFVVSESVHDQPTGQSWKIAASEPSSVLEFAVTPAQTGDHAYSIQSRDRSPFWLHACTVTTPSRSLEPAAPERPHHVSPTGAVSGDLAVAEAQFVKWLRDAVVVDTGKVLALELGPDAAERVQVQCQVDLDLAEKTSFEIELVDRQTTISTVVEQDGRLRFTAWGGGRVNISNPTQMWLWRSCELVD
ncbi:MAG TPA: hypothetical protein VK034_28895 [Enhygromyxa sp.]|nr:hypothetical protein [Enhygromyxa sp.]